MTWVVVVVVIVAKKADWASSLTAVSRGRQGRHRERDRLGGGEKKAKMCGPAEKKISRRLGRPYWLLLAALGCECPVLPLTALAVPIMRVSAPATNNFSAYKRRAARAGLESPTT